MGYQVGETVYYTAWNEAAGSGLLGVISSVTPDGVVVKLVTETDLESDYVTVQDFELSYPEGNAYCD